MAEKSGDLRTRVDAHLALGLHYFKFENVEPGRKQYLAAIDVLKEMPTSSKTDSVEGDIFFAYALRELQYGDEAEGERLYNLADKKMRSTAIHDTWETDAVTAVEVAKKHRSIKAIPRKKPDFGF